MSPCVKHSEYVEFPVKIAVFSGERKCSDLEESEICWINLMTHCSDLMLS